MLRVYISPNFRGEDRGDGGIRRVVEAQRRWLPEFDVEVVDDINNCDVANFHAGMWEEPPINVPVVASAHGLYWESYEWPRWALNLNKDVIRTLRQADATTAPSRWVAQALRRGMWLDPEVMWHGIEPEDWPAPDGDSGLGYVLWNKTRIDAICNPWVVNKLAEMAPDVPFVSTFGNPSTNVRILSKDGRTAVPYEQGKSVVRQAGVYLATSRETFGIGTLEAMAAGVPILGWNWGGQSEFVVHRTHGWLAEPDDYDDLLQGLRYCIEHREQLGAAARREVLTRFTWRERIEPYADLYRRVVRERRESCRVSVVVTNYNLGRYLPDAVKSVKMAGLESPDVEIIVVDDASTEPIPAVVADDPDVRVIRNDRNLYLAESLNVGISHARGRYIVPLDADNMLHINSLHILAHELDKHHELDIVYGKMQVLPEGVVDQTFVSPWPPQEASLDAQLQHHNQISSTAMYRRRVWERVGGYRRRCHTAEDADFWCRALAVGFTARRVTDAVTLVYRDRQDSMSHTQRDWAWHKWYQWARSPETRSFAAGGQLIPTHEFPIVSVIIPVGPGHERLVLDALDSLQNQTFRRWEAVVVNDTGGPLPWVHSWARVFDTDGRGQGASVARNTGIRAAKAPLVMFLDADDWLHPDALDRMVSLISEAGGFVYGDWFVAETGKYEEAPEWETDAVLRRQPYPVTCMYRRNDLIRNEVWFDESPAFRQGWEDWDFLLQAVVKAGLCGSRIASPLMYYRLKSGSLRETAESVKDALKQRVYQKWADYITGSKPNMAGGCGCGGGRFSGSVSYQSGEQGLSPNSQADPSLGEVVNLEYTGDEGGSRTFRGRVTGTRYRFGVDTAEHRTRRVFKEDAAWLMTLGIFREATQVSHEKPEPLQAEGPPEREPEVVTGETPTPQGVSSHEAMLAS